MNKSFIGVLTIVFLAALATVGYVSIRNAGARETCANLSYPESADPSAPVMTLDRDSTSKLYATFSVLTRSQRKTLFANLTALERSEIWAEHFRRFQAKRSLTVRQVGFLVDTIRLISGKPLSAELLPVGFADRANALFDKQLAAEAFHHLGGDSEQKKQQFNYRIAGMSFFENDCECNLSESFCDDPKKCKQVNGWPCNGTEAGCGWLWTAACNGRCVNSLTE